MDGGLHHFVCIIISVRMATCSYPSRRYPVYSLFLPVYSFWCMDEFGWGNTRLVIGEGNSKKILMNEDDKYDDSMIPLKKFSGKSSSRYSDPSIQNTLSRIRSRNLGEWFPSLK